MSWNYHWNVYQESNSESVSLTWWLSKGCACLFFCVCKRLLYVAGARMKLESIQTHNHVNHMKGYLLGHNLKGHQQTLYSVTLCPVILHRYISAPCNVTFFFPLIWMNEWMNDCLKQKETSVFQSLRDILLDLKSFTQFVWCLLSIVICIEYYIWNICLSECQGQKLKRV